MSAKPQVIILGAGVSNRMFPINTVPKAFLKLHGQTLLSHTLTSLAAAEFNEVVVVLSPGADTDAIRAETKHVSNLQLTFVTQSEPNGMGDALLAAKEHLKDQFFIIAPYHFDAPTAMELCLEKNNPNVICTTTTQTPWRYGIVELNGDVVTGIIEKPKKNEEPSNQKVQVCYLLNQEFVSILEKSAHDHYNFETALHQLAKQSTVKAVSLTDPLPTLKYPWDLLSLQKQLFSREASRYHMTARIAPTAVLDETAGPIIVEEGARIGHAAKIVGPTYIGRNALVGEFSFVRHSSIGTDVVVGANTEIVRSIMLPGSNIHFGYLADSIVDTNVSISAGLLTANKRLDRQHITVTIQGEKLETHCRALGIIVGSNTQIGIRVSTMPGVVIGPNSTVFPGVIMYDSVGPESTVK